SVTRKANPVTLGGVVRGTWAAKGSELTVTWLEATRPPQKAIEDEVRRLAGILDTDLHLILNT
ncbi:MAG: DNA glycosylase AlkZ-like family protein, partial [Nocardioides sp.]